MEEDRRVAPLKNADVRSHAKRLREFFGLKDAQRIDVIECLRAPRIWTTRGERTLQLRVRPDAEMRGAEGRTTSLNGDVLIELRQAVFDRAKMGEGRARNTCAHELGHGVLHEGAEMARLAVNNSMPPWMRAYESAEHQVKVFAPAFLINDQIAETLPSAEEISVSFGISMESAQIYYNDLIERKERVNTARKLRALAAELGEVANSTSAPKFLVEPCAHCGNQTIFPVGTKFMCHTCNAVSDRLQDGDPGE